MYTYDPKFLSHDREFSPRELTGPQGKLPRSRSVDENDRLRIYSAK
jgi:hypothetical protein